MHGNAQEVKQAHEREQLRNRFHQDFPSTLKAEPCGMPTVSQRVVGGIGELCDLSAKLNEILDRIQGPHVMAIEESVPPHYDPGLQGEIDKFRRLVNGLNVTADKILMQL